MVRRAGAEGTGSFGAALSRYLLAQGVDVFDMNRFDRADRRRRGKSDPLDAENAARAVLSGRRALRPRRAMGPWRSPGCTSWPRTRRSRPAPRRSTSSRPSSSVPIRS
ncbi:IS110 family transposase [Streptomyces sp. NRRL S-337]|uniref:IS110 family transposase n=1 Tax=Streptomyces sp. NRRL S-337 TaxID=1463900 RepID=UPI001F3C1C8F|nr:IS110 family transposase [Streptomyces sp. NRRL S-337]